MKQKAFLFSGGGFRCAGSAGSAVRAIQEDGGRMPDVVGGISGGGLNAAALAAKPPLGSTAPVRLTQLWVDAYNNPKSIFQDDTAELNAGKFTLSLQPKIRAFLKDYGLLKSLTQFLSKNPRVNQAFIKSFGLGLLKNDGLREMLDRNIGEIIRPLRFGYTCQEDARYYPCHENSFATREDFINGLIATTAMPVVCSPVPRINLANGTSTSQCVDAGISVIAPIKQVMDYMKAQGGEWELHVFLAHNRTLPYAKIETILDSGGRSLDIMMNTQITKDLKECMGKNQQSDTDPSKIFVDVFLYEPEVNEYGDTLDASMILHNYRAGYNNFNPIKLT